MSPISYQQYRSVLFSSYSHHDLLSLVLVCLFVFAIDILTSIK